MDEIAARRRRKILGIPSPSHAQKFNFLMNLDLSELRISAEYLLYHLKSPPAAGWFRPYIAKNHLKISYITNSQRDPPTPGGVLDKQVEAQSEPWFHFFLVI